MVEISKCIHLEDDRNRDHDRDHGRDNGRDRDRDHEPDHNQSWLIRDCDYDPVRDLEIALLIEKAPIFKFIPL